MPSQLECLLSVKDIAIYLFEFCLHSYWSVSLLDKGIRSILYSEELKPVKHKLYREIANRYINNCSIVLDKRIYKIVEGTLDFENRTLLFMGPGTGGSRERIAFNIPCDRQLFSEVVRCGRCGAHLNFIVVHDAEHCYAENTRKQTSVEYQRTQYEMKEFIYDVMYHTNEKDKAHLQSNGSLDWRKSKIAMTALWRLSELRYPFFGDMTHTYIALAIGEKDMRNKGYQTVGLYSHGNRNLICEIVDIEEIFKYNTEALCALRFISEMTINKPHISIGYFIKKLKEYRIAHNRKTSRLTSDFGLAEKTAPGVDKTLKGFLENYLVPMDYKIPEEQRNKMRKIEKSEDDLSEENSSSDDEEIESSSPEFDFCAEMARQEEQEIQGGINSMIGEINSGPTQESEESKKRKLDEIYDELAKG